MNGICIINYKSDNENKDKDKERESNEEDTKIQDIILENIEKSLISGDYNLSNIDNGKDEIYQDEKIVITLTTSNNQKNNINSNYTIIDLGECESLLRQGNNLADNQVLYIKKIDVFQDGMKIPNIEYDVYYKSFGNRLIKLDLSICEKSKISLFIPVIISENIDILNSSSKYYTDICYIATSDSGTDIILKDRKKEFIEGNKTVCQDDCDFSDYYINIQKAKCSCKVKKAKASIKDMKINKTKLYENFIDIENMINIKILICNEILFSKNGVIYNIAFYFIIPVIIFHIIVIILFYCYLKNIIDKEIKNIVSNINNLNNIKILKRKRKNMKSVDLLNIRNKTNINGNKIKSKNKSLQLIIHSDHPPNKKQGYTTKNINKNNNNIINNLTRNNVNSYIRFNKNKNKKLVVTESKRKMEYKPEELNDLSYKLALKLDQRTFCEYYVSLIKIKHILIFSFYNNEDYNIRTIKIDLFFIIFILYFMINALFFNDNTMHKIYEDEGSFNFVYQLPKIIYSSLISSVLNSLLKKLATSQGAILELKKVKKNINEKVEELNTKLKIKFIFYFIIGLIFLLFSWYYLSMFCAIYRNTQFHLIKDTLISFGLSLIYPFIIYLIPPLFRIPALSSPKKNRKYLYNLSLVIQMI